MLAITCLGMFAVPGYKYYIYLYDDASPPSFNYTSYPYDLTVDYVKSVIWIPSLVLNLYTLWEYLKPKGFILGFIGDFLWNELVRLYTF